MLTNDSKFIQIVFRRELETPWRELEKGRLLINLKAAACYRPYRSDRPSGTYKTPRGGNNGLQGRQMPDTSCHAPHTPLFILPKPDISPTETPWLDWQEGQVFHGRALITAHQHVLDSVRK